MSIRHLRGVALILAAVWVAPVAAQTTVYVDEANCPGPGSGSTLDPYCKIQDAICDLEASGGGTVMVRPGEYNESLRMFGGVSVVSTDGPDVTTIDGSGVPCTKSDCTPNAATTSCSTVVYGSGSTSADRLEGFTITGGAGIFRSVGADEFVAGGGVFIFNSSPTITNNEIVENSMSSSQTDDFRGAGLYVEGQSSTSIADPVITSNIIERNVADPADGSGAGYLQSYAFGGGIYLGQNARGTVDNNIIRDNRVGDSAKSYQLGRGGAISIYAFNAEPIISSNVLQDNYSADFGGAVHLGEVYVQPQTAASRALIENNVFEFNRTRFDGGAAHTRTSSARFHSNTVADNYAESYGGAFYVGKSENNNDQPSIVNTQIVFNDVEATYGVGGGIYVAPLANPTVEFDDLFGNTPENVGGSKDDSNYIGSDGNVSTDPLFANPGPRYRNLRLTVASQLLDIGDDARAPVTDKDGNARILDGNGDSVARIDPGAYEFDPAAGPDFDGDGTQDIDDPDDDNDGVDDAQDCDPFDSALTRAPSPIGATLTVDRSGTDAELAWGRGDPQGFVSNVYRGTITAGPWVYDESCWLAETPLTSVTDSAVPLPGEGFYYLVSSKNGCGETRIGQDNRAGVQNDLFPASPCLDQYADSDGDGVLDVRDNCALDANAAQADADLDFFGDLCDCVPYDPGNPPPGDVPGLVVEQGPSGTRLLWVDIGVDRYDVAGGLISELTAGGVREARCLADDVTGSAWEDPRPDPPAGFGYYYLTRGQSPCGAGTYGYDGSGGERLPASDCP